MGNSSSKKNISKGKAKLSKDDLAFLVANTNFDEATIREWHKGFYVSAFIIGFGVCVCVFSILQKTHTGRLPEREALTKEVYGGLQSVLSDR